MTFPTRHTTGATGPARTPATIAKAVGALLVLLTLLIAVPALLIALGAYPHALPSLDGLVTAITQQDSGPLLQTILTCAVWAAWAVFALAVGRETLAAIRTRGTGIASPITGLGAVSIPAASLVHTAAALFIATPVALSAVAPATAAAAAHTPTTAALTTAAAPDAGATPSAAPDAPTVGAAASVPAADTSPQGPRVTVVRRDTLWKLAETHLGEPMRWTEIRDLNAAQLGGGSIITPGMTLRLPDDAHLTPATPRPDDSTVTVRRGDTLSQLAVDHGLDPEKVAAANIGRHEPHGATLRDPDDIEPGWTLTLDTTAPAVAAADSVAGPRPTAPSPTPSATSTAPSRPPQATPSAAAPDSQAHAAGTASSKMPTPRPSTGSTHATTPASATESATAAASPAAASAPQSAQPSPNAQSTAADGPVDRGQVSLVVDLAAAGAGAMLAGGVLTALIRSRRRQARHRRPGHTLVPVPADLVPIERDLIVTGPAGIVDAEYLDRALRHLAEQLLDVPRSDRPDIIAARMTADGLTLRLDQPRPVAPRGWSVDASGLWWSLPADAHLPTPDGSVLAPLPTLVTIGGAGNARWMIDLERAGTIRIHGDHAKRMGLARFMAAELGVNAWSDLVRVTCVGFGPELVDLAPERIDHLTGSREDLRELLAQIETAAALTASNEHALDARVEQDGADSVMPHITLIGPGAVDDADQDLLEQVLAALAASPNRTSLAVVLTDLPATSTSTAGEAEGGAPGRELDIVVDADGSLRIDSLGMQARAETLTQAEAEGLAGLVAAACEYTTAPVPDAQGSAPWVRFASADGTIRRSLTLPRDPKVLARPATATDPTSILTHTDQTYLTIGATTSDELSDIAPMVPVKVRDEIEAADPTLDADLAEWNADTGTRPRIQVMGPVQVRGAGTAPANRLAHYTELAVYLATRTYGATAEQVADAFEMSAARAATDVSTVRKWMGKDTDGADYIPAARRSSAAQQRGIGTYELRDALIDSDLFRRLRLRGKARGGAAGLADLQAALDLVTGIPFDHLAPGGYGWLLEGDRLDHHLTHAVVDTAHELVLAAQAAGDLAAARAAAEKARSIAPYEDTPTLDLAAIKAAEGDRAGANTLLRTQVVTRSEDGGGRDDLPERTQQIITATGWYERAS